MKLAWSLKLIGNTMPSDLLIYPYLSPGSYGINTVTASTLLDSKYCRELDNVVISEEGLLTPRNVFEASSNQPSNELINFFASFARVSGTNYERVWGWQTSGTMYVASGPTGSWAAPAGAYTGSASNSSNFMGLRFREKAYFYARNAIPRVGTMTTGAVNDISPNTAPRGHIALAAFGRLWCADTDTNYVDKRTLYWSVLLNGDDWAGAGSGSLDMSNVWGDDETIMALAQFNAFLVVFGRRKIVILDNPFTPSISSAGAVTSGTTMTVKDIIEGVGCIGRDCVANGGDDLYFVSERGVHSLSRVIQEKSNPIANVSINISDQAQSAAASGFALYQQDSDLQHRLVFDRNNNRLMWFLPGSAYIFHLALTDNKGIPVVTTWSDFYQQGVQVYETPTGTYQFLINTQYFNTSGTYVPTFTFGQLTSGGATEKYTVTYKSGWETYTAEGKMKLPKRLVFNYYSTSSTPTPISLKMYYDYSTTAFSTYTFAPATASSGYRAVSVPVGGRGHAVSQEIYWDVTGANRESFQLVSYDVQFKLARSFSGV